MKKLLLLAIALALTACSATKFPNTNTTAWASMGDAVFAADTLPDHRKFSEFAALDDMQNRITPTNLTIRQRILWAAADVKNGYDYTANEQEARWQFQRVSDLPYWPEGVEYFHYVRDPLLWYHRLTGREIVPLSMLADMDSAYASLASPTGEIALPEVAAGYHYPPGRGSSDTRAYSVRRWYEGDTVVAYLLVAKSTVTRPFNLHSHLEAGYFALWIRGRWVVRCQPYTGWDERKAVTEDGFYDLLPKGAVTPNSWRVRPPAITVKENANAWRFTWGKRASRVIQAYGDRVVVTDDGAHWWNTKHTRTWSTKKL